MIRRTFLTLALLASSVAPVALLDEPGATMLQDPARPAPAVCHEDEPCFDCFTMGNGVCGVLVDDQGVWWPCWAIARPCDEEG